ncbi:DUF1269 domain-containing protein [Agromyces protaetiae]|uniref:DUF1269 domain-containing protein n=1 Tax=Agromyces protaetiae TaxID=2509455 RepID=A0A4P6F8B7_9MICO|nr:DUF6325 family protein [Agromyces protaetiae]QAY72340.1 DUF1269 domain-containing protein [Agromyces protaetiae]
MIAGFGPGELCVIGFPGDGIPERARWAIVETLAQGVVTLLDAVLLTCDHAGVVRGADLDAIGDGFDVAAVEAGATGLIGDDDLDRIAAALEPGTSVLVLLVEHTWARRIQAALEPSGAEVVATRRLPGAVLDEVAVAAGVPRAASQS